MAFWGIEVKPKMPLPLNIERRLVVKQAALVITKSSAEPCVLSVSVEGSDQQYVVCRLHEGRVEHCTLELPFSPSDNVTLHLKGSHSVHLTGFLDLDEDDDVYDKEDAAALKGLEDNDDDDDEDDDDDYDDMDDDDEDGEEGEEEDAEEGEEGEEEDDEEGEEEDDDEDEDDEEDEVVLPPPTKKAKTAAAPPPAAAAPPAKQKGGAAAAPTPSPKPATPAAAAAGAAVASPNPWSKEEEMKFKKALAANPDGAEKRWEKVAAAVGTRTKEQCKKKYQMDKKGPTK